MKVSVGAAQIENSNIQRESFNIPTTLTNNKVKCQMSNVKNKNSNIQRESFNIPPH